jgi:hypothetical protein
VRAARRFGNLRIAPVGLRPEGLCHCRLRNRCNRERVCRRLEMCPLSYAIRQTRRTAAVALVSTFESGHHDLLISDSEVVGALDSFEWRSGCHFKTRSPHAKLEDIRWFEEPTLRKRSKRRWRMPKEMAGVFRAVAKVTLGEKCTVLIKTRSAGAASSAYRASGARRRIPATTPDICGASSTTARLAGSRSVLLAKALG